MPPNDSDERLPQSRRVNDFVDVFYEGAWWLGVICEVWPNYINAYFPSSNEIYTHIKKNDERRVRTRFEYTKNAGGNFEYTLKKRKQNKYFINAEGERIKWKFPQTVEAVVIPPPASSEKHEEVEEQEQTPPPASKPSSTKTTPNPRSRGQERALPKEKHAIALRHLIQYNFIAPGDVVYVLEDLGGRHGTVMEDGRIMVDRNFKTTKKPTAPREYLYHVASKNSKFRRVLRTQHWQDVYARLGVDRGVRQLQELRDALFNGKPLPPPLASKDAPLPKSLAGAGGSGGAGPSKQPQVKNLPSTEKEAEISNESSDKEIEIVLDEEEEEEIEDASPIQKPTEMKTTPKPPSTAEKMILPVKKAKFRLKHLIDHKYIAPGDAVYVLEHLESRHGTVMEDGSIMVDKNFSTSSYPTAPKEYLYHVVPKDSKLRRILRTRHWQDVYVRLSLDCGVRQLVALRNVLFDREPLPPPLADKHALLPKSLAAAGVKGAVAGPSKRQQVKEPLTEEEEEEESSQSEKESENHIDHHKDATIEEEVELMDTEEEEEEGQSDIEDQEDSVLASEFFGPSEDEEDTAVGERKSPLVAQPRIATGQFGTTKNSPAAAAAALVSRKRPASAEKRPQPKKQNKEGANKQVGNLLKDLMEESDSHAAPSGPTLSPLRATQKKQTTAPNFAFKSVIEKAPSSSPPSSSSPSLSTSPAPRQVVAVKPPPPPALASKSSLLNQQPALRYLPSVEEKKVWCLDNVPQWVLAPALQKALTAEIPTGIINVDASLVNLDNGRFSHPGYAVIRFSTANLAEKAEPVLRQLCIRTSACGIPRPLILRRPWLTKDYPWGKKDSLPGHLPLQMQEPPPPHYAQPNTVEFEMAVHWTQLERAISTARNTLHKEQAYELAKVMSQYLLKQQQGKYHGDIDEGALHAPPPPPPPSSNFTSSSASRGSPFLWIRGVSPTLKAEKLKEVFAQHGYTQKAEMLRDKVTKQVNGTALVQMESVDRALKVARNMQDMEYMFGGSPRPIQVEVAKPGGPRGSQSVFDRALRAVVGKHDFEATTLQLIRIPEVIKETASLEDRAAGCLRELMMTHRTEQDAARQVAREARTELALEQVEQFSMESEKMNRLKALHDGQAYKKMCDLHKLAIRRLRHFSPVHLT